jgi:signal transduction histidine kinase
VHGIEVADTGCGIAAEAIPHIFKRFYRESSTDPPTGFGFGLFVVKCFTDLLGGSIDVTSERTRVRRGYAI